MGGEELLAWGMCVGRVSKKEGDNRVTREWEWNEAAEGRERGVGAMLPTLEGGGEVFVGIDGSGMEG